MPEKIALPTSSPQWPKAQEHLNSAKQLCSDVPVTKKVRRRASTCVSGESFNSRVERIIEQLTMAHNLIHNHAPLVQHNPFISLKLFLSKNSSTDFAPNFLRQSLPAIIDLALTLDINNLPLNLASEEHELKHQYSTDVTVYELELRRSTIASLLACMFLCLIPRKRPETLRKYNQSDFCEFFPFLEHQVQESKLTMILRYFNTVLDLIKAEETVKYRLLTMRGPDETSWLSCSLPLCDTEVKDDGKIEDQVDHMQVDFANEYIGGGVLETGRVQEEIRFCAAPELLVSMIFMRRMKAHEAIHISGFQTFSEYTGYADSLLDGGDYQGASERDESGNVLTKLTAIDANCYCSWTCSNANVQYNPDNILRDLNKAFVGFQQPGSPSLLQEKMESERRQAQVLAQANQAKMDSGDVETVIISPELVEAYSTQLSNTIMEEVQESLRLVLPDYFGFNVTHYDPINPQSPTGIKPMSPETSQPIDEVILDYAERVALETVEAAMAELHTSHSLTVPPFSYSHNFNLTRRPLISLWEEPEDVETSIEEQTVVNSHSPSSSLLSSPCARSHSPRLSFSSQGSSVSESRSSTSRRDSDVMMSNTTDIYKTLLLHYSQALSSSILTDAFSEFDDRQRLLIENNVPSCEYSAARRLSSDVVHGLFTQLGCEMDTSDPNHDKLGRRSSYDYENYALDIVDQAINHARDIFGEDVQSHLSTPQPATPTWPPTNQTWRFPDNRRSSAPVNVRPRQPLSADLRRGSAPSVMLTEDLKFFDIEFNRGLASMRTRRGCRRSSSLSSKKSEIFTIPEARADYGPSFGASPGSGDCSPQRLSPCFLLPRAANRPPTYHRSHSQPSPVPQAMSSQYPGAVDVSLDIEEEVNNRGPLSPSLQRQYMQLYAETVSENVLHAAYACVRNRSARALRKRAHQEEDLQDQPVRKLCPIASGNWGCGVFGGDPQLKALLQWMAATRAGAPKLVYYTFNNDRVSYGQLSLVYEKVRGNSVCWLMDLILKYSKIKEQTPLTLFQYILIQCEQNHS